MRRTSAAAPRRTTVSVPRASSRRTSRLAGLVLAGVVAATPFALAGPAAAHDSLTGSTPADGSTVATAPDRVTLIFSDPVKQIGLTVLVKDPSGAPVTDGTPTIDGNTVLQQLAPLTISGVYTVAYRVVSSDGHPISGRITFTADAAELPSTSLSAAPSGSISASPSVSPASTSAVASPTPSESVVAASPVAASTADGGGAGWIVAGAGLLAVLVVVGVVLVRRRSA